MKSSEKVKKMPKKSLINWHLQKFYYFYCNSIGWTNNWLWRVMEFIEQDKEKSNLNLIKNSVSIIWCPCSLIHHLHWIGSGFNIFFSFFFSLFLLFYEIPFRRHFNTYILPHKRILKETSHYVFVCSIFRLIKTVIELFILLSTRTNKKKNQKNVENCYHSAIIFHFRSFLNIVVYVRL